MFYLMADEFLVDIDVTATVRRREIPKKHAGML